MYKLPPWLKVMAWFVGGVAFVMANMRVFEIALMLAVVAMAIEDNERGFPK